MLSTTHASADEYANAWRQLNDFYGDSHALHQAYFGELFAMPLMRSATPNAIHRLLSTTREILGFLYALNFQVEVSKEVIIFAVIRCFGDDLRGAWVRHRAKQTPTITMVYRFLETRVRELGESQAQPAGSRQTSVPRQTGASRQAEPRAGQMAPSSGSTARRSVEKVNPGPQRAAEASMPVQTGVVALTPNPSANVALVAAKKRNRGRRNKISRHCHACSQEHFLQDCALFQSWSIDVRKRHVIDWMLCPNCFRPHVLRDCPYGPCRQCVPKIWHNSLLCRAHETRARQVVDVQTPPACSISVANPNAARQSPVMRSQVATSFRRLGWSTPETWPLPDPAIRLQLSPTAVLPQLRSLPQFDNWESTLRQNPQARDYLPPIHTAVAASEQKGAQSLAAQCISPVIEKMDVAVSDLAQSGKKHCDNKNANYVK